MSYSSCLALLPLCLSLCLGACNQASADETRPDAGGGTGLSDTSDGPRETSPDVAGATGQDTSDGVPARRTGCSRKLPFDGAALQEDVAYLASEALDGRLPGSPGDKAARKLVADRFKCLGLSMPDGMSSYEQPFTNEDGQVTANVLALVRGSDVALANEVLVLSAHTDHLGAGKLGANDDASGVAALLAIADAVVHGPTPPKRTIVFAAFGSEESGFEGSEYFVTHPPTGLAPSRIVFSVNMDMIGSYTISGQLWALGAFDGTPGAQAVKDVAARYPTLDVGYGEGSDLSDNVTFCSRGIPYLFFWTEDEPCYHKSCDTADRIDVPNMSAIARLTGDVTLAIANMSGQLAKNRKPGKDVCLAPN